jgi:hypothetical protein
MSRGHLHHLSRIDGERRRLGRSDHGLPHARHALGEDPAATRVELREDVVEEHERRRRQQVGLGKQEREDGEPLLALRAELTQVALAARDRHVVEVRPDSGRAAIDVPVEPCLERLHGRRLRVVAEVRVRQAELSGALGEAGREQAQHFPACVDERAAEGRDAFRPRLECVTRRDSELHTAQRCVALRERGGVLLRRRCPSRQQACECAIEVRTPRRRPAFHDRQPVGCEDERVELAPQQLGRRQPRAVHLGHLRLTQLQRHVDPQPNLVPNEVP